MAFEADILPTTRFLLLDLSTIGRIDHNVANRDGIPETIVEMAINGSGVRDTSRVLGVSITTVIAHLKKIKARPR